MVTPAFQRKNFLGGKQALERDMLRPMNRDNAGARAQNSGLQEALNPAKPGQLSADHFGYTFCVGDEVMQTENNYDRDVSTAISVSSPPSTWKKPSWPSTSTAAPSPSAQRTRRGQPRLRHTIHKSQGSEYPAVVVPVLPSTTPCWRAT
jgi:exodeoxyribonuclease V alpha subunit